MFTFTIHGLLFSFAEMTFASVNTLGCVLVHFIITLCSTPKSWFTSHVWNKRKHKNLNNKGKDQRKLVWPYSMSSHLTFGILLSFFLLLSAVFFFHLGIKGWGQIESSPFTIFLALNFYCLTDYQKLWYKCLFVNTSFDANWVMLQLMMSS